jgi:hypothetical protein
VTAATTELMADVDLSRWPVVAVRLDDITGTTDVAALLGAVTSALERRRPFGLLIAAEAPLTDAAVQAEPLRWLRRRRTEVGTWCRGVVYVLLDRAAARFGAADRAAAQRLWGCDVRAVHDHDAGRVWMLARLDPDART